MIESNEIGLVWKYEFETMKIRCAHLTVQLVDRQDRDVKGESLFTIEVAPRPERPHTDFSVCGLFVYPRIGSSKKWAKER